MTRFLSLIGILAALVLVAASAFMNYQFAAGQGKDELNGYIFGATSVAFDVLKALLPFFLIWAFQYRRPLGRVAFVSVGSFLFVGLIGFSLMSAFGFVAKNRNHTTTSQSDMTSRFKEIGQQISRLQEKQNWQPKARSQGVIEQEIKVQEQHRRFATTKKCTNATATKSRKFCGKYFELTAEKEAARTRTILQAKIDNLAEERKALRTKGASREADPQAGLLAELTGLEIKDTQTALIVFMAVLVEAAAAFGLYLATAHGGLQTQPTLRKASKPGNDNTKPKIKKPKVRAIKNQEFHIIEALPEPEPKTVKEEKKPKERIVVTLA